MNKIKFLSKKHLKFYAVIAILFVFLYLISFFLVYNTVYQNTIEKNQIKLVQMIENMDTSLELLTHTGNTIYYDPTVINLMKKDHISAYDYTMLNDVRSILNLSNLQNAETLNFYMYFPRSNALLDQYRIYFSIDEMTNSLETLDNMDAAEFKEKILDMPSGFLPAATVCTIDPYDNNRKVIPYKLALPDNDNLIIVLLLDIDRINQMLLNTLNHTTDYTILSGDTIIYSTLEENPSMSDVPVYGNHHLLPHVFRNNFKISCSSPYNNYTFTFLFTKSYMYSIMKDILWAYVLIFFVLIVIFSIIFFALEMRFNKPYYAMSEKYIAHENNIHDYYLNRLLDPLSAETEISDALKYLNINPASSMAAALITKTASAPGGNLIPQIHSLLGQLEMQASCIVKYTNIDKRDTVVVLMHNFDNFDKINRIICDSALHQNNHYLIGCGSVFDSPRGICVSYAQANTVIEYNQIYNTNQYTCYVQLPQISNVVVMEPEKKNKLELMIVSGIYEDAIAEYTSLFNKFCRVAFVLNPIASNNFIAQTVGLLMQCTRSINTTAENKEVLLSEIARLFNISNPDRFLEGFSQIVLKITSYAPSETERDKTLADDLLKYIDENYSDSNLSLSLLSETFKKNESYISQFFKQQTNQNFSQYLEAVRMKAAEHMLTDTKYNINDIFQMVGYANRNTFYKAFVRLYGVSPKVYRQHNQHLN